MTPGLEERARALEPLGVHGAEARWVALACLHGGVFSFRQARAFLDCGRRRLGKFLDGIEAGGLATRGRVGKQGICRVVAPRVYRALDADLVHHRERSLESATVRRLLTLDYVLERSDVPWLGSAAEKTRAFARLGVQEDVLPAAKYGPPGRPKRRYVFHAKLPVAVEPERAVFAYVDPGHCQTHSVRRWADAHEPLWRRLRAEGLRVEAAIVARTRGEVERARRIAAHWAPGQADGTADPGAPTFPEHREIEALERAVRTADAPAVERAGGVAACLDRIVELRERMGALQPEGLVDRCRVWRSERFAAGAL